MGVFQDIAYLHKQSKQQFNHLHSELVYRFFDRETDVFENADSHGVGFQVGVLGGSNDELIETLNRLVCEFPQGEQWDYQFCLVGNNMIEPHLRANQKRMSVRGGVCEKMAKLDADYYSHASQNGFTHRQSHYFDVRNYQAFFFVTTKASKAQLVDFKETFTTAAQVSGLNLSKVLPHDLIWYVEQVLNFNRDSRAKLEVNYNEFEPLNSQMLSPDSEYLTKKDHVEARFTDQSNNQQHYRIVSLGLRRLPADFRLYGLPECFSSVRNVAKSVQCPSVMVVNFKIDDKGRSQTQNDTKIADLTKTLESKLRAFVPTAGDELQERKDLQKGLLSQEFLLASMSVTLILLTNESHQKKHVAAASTSFSSAGLELMPIGILQAQAVMSSLPFQMLNYRNDLKKAGRINTLKTSNLVNFFPITMDHKNLSGGVLLPTMRQQLSFFDPWKCGSDNQNIALSGGSGSGKSFLTQKIVDSVYSQGGKVWIMDKGGSFKKTTLRLGGVYMTPSEIFLNPFTHLGSFSEQQDGDVDPLKLALDNITALFASMSSPKGELSDFQMAILGDAIVKAWGQHKQNTKVNDVQSALFSEAQALREQGQNGDEIAKLGSQLNKFCVGEIYGDIFNKPSMLNPNNDITTLELDGFPSAVMRPVIFALMVAINQQMYLSGDRSTRKLCVIEEAWSLLSGANESAREFIQLGYRTARKFGGAFLTVTQGFQDFFANPEAQACYNNSDIRIIMRQGAAFDSFIKENPNIINGFEEGVIRNFEKAGVSGYSSLMLKVGENTSFHRFFADPYTRATFSTEPEEWQYTETLLNQGVDIHEAIDKTSNAFYGAEIAEFNQKVYGVSHA
ncbi:type IV secretion system protein TraC [Vibrio cyclitrophicus]|uniref:Type-IV secretion system protein TraC n=2 Tax=Vibrio cyclitrophicus TaxID=47951 RepID=A0A7Z1S215_9VIBR|nr:type IV secretion system protein TraC [Vibrio cyclitrophicus]PMP21134.1 type-IV secretion system protein TraC [Vibrio cyclitrophicus]PMP30519.1 type-IV secretion system protein TraC [Vibrio cyclitrophicus]